MIKKNIALVNIGEPLPRGGNKPHRMMIWNEFLLKQGYNTRIITTDFEHQRKIWIKEKESDFIYLKSYVPYFKNISVLRLINHFLISIGLMCHFFRKGKEYDLIICSYPTVLLSFISSTYGKVYSTPVFIDVRDLWPDIFIKGKMTKLFIFPLILIKKITFNCSRLNIAISPGYKDWVKSSSPSSKTEIIPLTKNHVTEKQKFFDGVINFSFVGTLGDTYDLEMIFNLEKLLDQRRINFQINICGDGPKAKYIQNRINTKNIVFHGWLAETELQSVLDHTHFGLMFYNKSSPQGWPNKLFEFMSNGIPIINTLKGESYKLIKEKKLGYNISSELDIDSVLDKILNDIESKQYFEIVRNNYDTFKRNFSNDSGNRKLLSLIKKHLS